MVKLMEHTAMATIAVREGGLKSIGLFTDPAASTSRDYSQIDMMYFQVSRTFTAH